MPDMTFAALLEDGQIERALEIHARLREIAPILYRWFQARDAGSPRPPVKREHRAEVEALLDELEKLTET
jgi:hypothetical protein